MNTLLFIIQGVRTIVFIFIVICTTFQPMCPPAFFMCFLSNSKAYNMNMYPAGHIARFWFPKHLSDNHLEVAGSILTAGE